MGMTHGNKDEKEVWKLFADDPERLRSVADAIKGAITAGGQDVDGELNDDAPSARPEPGCRSASEKGVPFCLGEPCRDLLIGLIETLESPGQPVNWHVAAEHAACRTKHLDDREDPGGDLLPLPAHAEYSLDRHDFDADVRTSAQ